MLLNYLFFILIFGVLGLIVIPSTTFLGLVFSCLSTIIIIIVFQFIVLDVFLTVSNCLLKGFS